MIVAATVVVATGAPEIIAETLDSFDKVEPDLPGVVVGYNVSCILSLVHKHTTFQINYVID